MTDNTDVPAGRVRSGRYIDEETLRRRREQHSWYRRNRGKSPNRPLTEQEVRLLTRFSPKDDA